MDFTRQRFPKEGAQDFHRVLRKKVNAYFKENNISKFGNNQMRFKTIFMIALYFVPFIVILTGSVTQTLPFIFLWVLMGLGGAGIGLSIMHDANHGSLFKSRKLNDLLGLTMNLIGSNAYVWKLQHNVLHHTYTNVEGTDDDINFPVIFRFSPSQKKYWFHRFQHIYAWLLYAMMTLFRVFVSDFTRLNKYYKMGVVSSKKVYRQELIKMTLWKMFYVAYVIVLPILIVPVSPWLIIGSFLIMHAMIGFILAVIFQPAHVNPLMEFPKPDNTNTMPNSWAVHEMLTTTNFAPKSRLFSWFIGGLNYQVEHHLFANICHVHYKKLSKIVKETAQEFNLPYHSEKTFVKALWEHAMFLRKLGMGTM